MNQIEFLNQNSVTQKKKGKGKQRNKKCNKQKTENKTSDLKDQ